MKPPNTKNPAYIVLYAAVTALIFTGAIMALHVATAETVERNQQVLSDQGKIEMFYGREVLEGLSEREIVEYIDERVEEHKLTDPETGRAVKIMVAYETSEKQRIAAYGFEIDGVGFWAAIKVLLAVGPQLDEIKGIYFLQHQETPGLGGRITEWEWRKEFIGLKLDEVEDAPAPRYIYIGGSQPTGPPREGRWVDAITGATGTSNAVEAFVNQDIGEFLRAIRASEKFGPNAPTDRRDGDG